MSSPPVLAVFRSRAVVVAGRVDVAFGLGALAVGSVIASRRDRPSLFLGMAIVFVGVLLFAGGLGRVTARLEICADRMRWWYFGRHEIPLQDLVDAALVEKGAPASGAAWAAYLPGGLPGVLTWWLGELAYSGFSNEPSLGPVELVAMQRHGVPVEVRAIGAWSTRASHSEANRAVQALKTAIAAAAPPTRASRQLLHDGWEEPRPGGPTSPEAKQGP
jgi:hypothetical protein